MKLFVFIGLCLAVAQSAEIESRALDVCYGELGCFTVRNPFSGTLDRPIAMLPQAEDKINAKFCLYTKANPTTVQYITHQALDPLFDPSKPTKFIIHGFMDTGFSKHFIDMKNALLSAGDFNVVVVDWSGGNGLPYTQANANTQMVGALIARLVNTYAKNYGLNVDDVHIIGHSLGAHTAGYAGARIPGLGRITGLDPAGPGFENTDKIVRLDEGDAKFVDIIHSDGSATLLLGLGLMQKSGHVDFFVNGGKDQPNCPQTSGKLLAAIFNLVTVDLQGMLDTTACSHMAAVYFFTDSVRNAQCKYTAYPCKSQDDLNKGNCGSCGVSGCNQMGFYASKSKDLGSLYLSTQDADKYPYCEHFYLVTLNSNSLSGQTQTNGWFKITLHGEVASSSTILLTDTNTVFKSGSSVKKFKASTVYIGETVQSASVLFGKTTDFLTAWLYQDQWSFKNIQILSDTNQNSVTLCPDQTYIKSGATVNFKRC